MGDIKLDRRSALNPFLKDGRYGTINGSPGVIIREVSDFSLASITAYRGLIQDLSKAIHMQFGIELPSNCRTCHVRGITFIGVAPAQWLAHADNDEAGELLKQLDRTVGKMASVVDLSDARAVIEISGVKVREALAKGLSIDLDPSTFKADHAANTFAAQLGITMWRVNEVQTFRLAVFRAFGGSLLEWLISSTAEFGCDILVL